MVPTLQTIKGGGGSIKVGTTGTISALISRELESTETAAEIPVSLADTCHTVSDLELTGATTPKLSKPKTLEDKASGSNYNSIDHKLPGNARKAKHYNHKAHQVPILNSDSIFLDGTPIREKPEKRGTSYIVEVVDVKCGIADRTWASPIKSRLKKMGFSKLSENTV